MRNSVSNHQPHDCLLNCLFRHRSKKISQLRVAGLCEGNSSVTGEFSAKRSSNAENISIWWRHHENHFWTMRVSLAKISSKPMNYDLECWWKLSARRRPWYCCSLFWLFFFLNSRSTRRSCEIYPVLQLTKNPGSPIGPPSWYAGWSALILECTT